MRWMRAATAVGATVTVLAMALAVPTGSATASAASTPAAPALRVAVSPAVTIVNGLVTMSTAGSRVPAGVRSAVVDFGDRSQPFRGTALPGTRAHRYARAGNYVVVVRVTDRLNRVGQVRRGVSVSPRVPRGLGAVPPARDVRQQSPLVRATPLPASADLRGFAMAVMNQGAVYSCVAWAIDYAMLGWYANRDHRQGAPFAPMYTYSQINHGVDKGSRPADALDVARTQGTDTASHYGAGWATEWRVQPTAEQRANAANYKILGWRDLFAHVNSTGADDSEIYDMKAELAAGHPVAVTMRLADSFYVFRGSVFTDTSPATAGSHEMLALGYDATGLLVQNSWGTGWGAAGFARLSWAVVQRDVYEADVIDGLAPVRTNGDTTAPVVTAPTQRMVAGTVTGSAGVPVTISWSGSDTGGTVSGYVLWASTNGAAWTQQTLPSQSSTSMTFALAPGSSYRFAVRARDAAGNQSAWAYGPTFHVNGFTEHSAGIAYSAGWHYQAWDSAAGGYLATASSAGVSASFTFTGTNAAWIASRAANRGEARVYLDGEFQLTVDLYSASTVARSLAVVVNSESAGTHRIDIVVVGTPGRPTVDIDSFIVLA